MTKYFTGDYWPIFNTKEKRIFTYSAPDQANITTIFSYSASNNCMLYDDYDSKMVWKDRWYYNYRPGFGIAEFRDDYPFIDIFGHKINKVVSLDPPIGWGDWLEIGVPYTNSPKMSFFGSFPPQISQGFQVVVTEALLDTIVVNGVVYRNVLQFVYDQSWNGKSGGGARYYMAKGVGPVALQWKTPQNVFSSRMDARVEIQP